MIFRLSQKLNARIKGGTLSARHLSENLFADWSAHLFVASRTPYILLSNTKSLYSTVIHAGGITNANLFINHALKDIREFMEYDGQAFIFQQFIAPTAGTIYFAKALDRSVTGAMSDMVRLATVWLADSDISPFDVGFKLNDVAFSSLPHVRPREELKATAAAVE